MNSGWSRWTLQAAIPFTAALFLASCGKSDAPTPRATETASPASTAPAFSPPAMPQPPPIPSSGPVPPAPSAAPASPPPPTASLPATAPSAPTTGTSAPTTGTSEATANSSSPFGGASTDAAPASTTSPSAASAPVNPPPPSNTVVAAAPNAPAAPTPPPTVLGTGDHEVSGVEVTLLELKRTSGDTLTARWRYRNTNAEQKALTKGTGWTDSWALSMDSYFVDSSNKKKYLVVKDSSGQPLAGSHGGSGSIKIGAGQTITTWAKYPAPPESVQKVTLYIPGVAPFEDIPISR